MNEEIRTIVQHGPVGTHSAAGKIDPPSLPGRIARPDERDRTLVRRHRPEMPGLRFTRDPGCPDIFELHAIKNILTRRKTFKQQLRGEVMIRQRVRRCGADHGFETFTGGVFHPHARGAIGSRPHDCRTAGHIARLNSASDPWTIRGPAQIRPRQISHTRERDGRR